MNSAEATVCPHRNSVTPADLAVDGAERAAGAAANALGLSRCFLERRIEQVQADRDHPILPLSAQGQRWLLAAEALQRLGQRQFSSIAGGFDRWNTEGLPITASSLDTNATERYMRQLRLAQVGATGQAALTAANNGDPRCRLA